MEIDFDMKNSGLLSPKVEQDSASFSMHIPDEQKQAIVSTTYLDPKEWRPSGQTQLYEQANQVQTPLLTETQVENTNRSITRSKTAIDLSAKRRSTPNISATKNSKNGTSPLSKRVTMDSSRQNSSNNGSPRRYTGSTGKYYEDKVDKIFETSMNHTARSAYNKTGNTSTNASPGRRRSVSPFSDSPLKTLHSGGR